MPSLKDSAETKALIRFWEEKLERKGTLVTEFPVSVARRRIDGVVIPSEKDGQVVHGREVDLEGKDVILVEVKKRLGRFLAGQAFFAIGLIAPLKPASIRSIALCNKDDPDLRPLLEEHNVEVEVVPWPTAGPETTE